MAAFGVGRSGMPHWESSLKSTFIASRPSSNSVISPSPSLPSRGEFPRRAKSQHNGYIGVRQTAESDPLYGLRNNTAPQRGVRTSVNPTRNSILSRVSNNSGAINGDSDVAFADSSPDKVDRIQLRGERVGNGVEDNVLASSPRNMLPNLNGHVRSQNHSSQLSERPHTTYTRVKSNTYLARSESYSSLPGLSISQITPSMSAESSTGSSVARSASADPAMLKSRDKTTEKKSEDGFRSKEEMLRALKKKLGAMDEMASTNKRPYTVRKQAKTRSAQSLHQQWVSEGITNPYMERPQSRIVRKSPGLRGMFLRPQDSATYISPASRICPPNCNCCFKVALQPEKQPDAAGQQTGRDSTGGQHNNSPLDNSDDESKKTRKVQFSV